MASVRRLSDAAAPHLLMPRFGPGVCADCCNLTLGYDHCYACGASEPRLAAMLPISYSVAHEHLHHALVRYKRASGPWARDATAELAAVLWRFLERHEACLAAAARVERFDLVTTVPSSDPARDESHPLRRIVGELVKPTRTRYERLLVRSSGPVVHRRFDPGRYTPTRRLAGEHVLLVDDTWTTGASAQSAAAALQAEGAAGVAAVVIGRHVNRDWGENARRLDALRGPFDFAVCVRCAEPSEPAFRAVA